MTGNHNVVFSSVVRAGRTTYFVDVKEARNGNRYLSISETRLDADDRRLRSTLRVFGESIDQFRLAVDEATSAIRQ